MARFVPNIGRAGDKYIYEQWGQYQFEVREEEDKLNIPWDAWGHYHILLGLLLWHEDTGDRRALRCAKRMGDFFCNRFLGKNKPRLVDLGETDKNMAIIHGLCLLYGKTRTPRYLELALRIVDEFAVREEDGGYAAGDYLNVGMHSASGRWVTYNTPMDGLRASSAHQNNWHQRVGTSELNCCSVNGPCGFGMISDWAVMSDGDRAVILNYYGPGVILTSTPSGVNVTLMQETEYPRRGRVAIAVSPARRADFALWLRIPYWSKKTRLRLNGRALRNVKPGNYYEIQRTWQRGDRIEIDLDLSLHYWVGEDECAGSPVPSENSIRRCKTGLNAQTRDITSQFGRVEPDKKRGSKL